jgi:hypothetical protein
MRAKKLPPPEKRCEMDLGHKGQCRAPRRKNSKYCFFHQEEAQFERMALGEKLMRLKWVNPSDLHEVLVTAVEAVQRKKLDPQRAYALACLVKQIQENLPAVDKELQEHQQSGYVNWKPEMVEKLAWKLLESEEEREASEEEEGAVGREEEGEEEKVVEE